MVMLVLDRMRSHVRSSDAAQPQQHGNQNGRGQSSTQAHERLPMRRTNGFVPALLHQMTHDVANLASISTAALTYCCARPCSSMNALTGRP